MARREELSDGYSQSMFARTAARVHPLNKLHGGTWGPMRGGIRL